MNFSSEAKPIGKVQNTVMVWGQSVSIIDLDGVEIQMIEVGREKTERGVVRKGKDANVPIF